jgi:hypothetical protein
MLSPIACLLIMVSLIGYRDTTMTAALPVNGNNYSVFKRMDRSTARTSLVMLPTEI